MPGECGECERDGDDLFSAGWDRQLHLEFRSDGTGGEYELCLQLLLLELKRLMKAA